MTNKPRDHVNDLRGASRLAIEATRGVTDLVEAMQETIASGPKILGRPLEGPTRMINRWIFGGIRGVTGVVGASIDRALAQLAPLLENVEFARGLEADAVLGVLNGVLGDYLHETHNPLEIEMRFRHGGTPLEIDSRALRAALPDARNKLLVLVHGSCMTDRQWNRHGHDHGAALARDLGYTAVYLHYNSGLHISTNGRAFAALLERLVAEWPTPANEVVILAHSMGGLVARCACRIAEGEGQTWRRTLRAMIFLGSPHHGAPLERAGNWFQQLLGISRYSAPLARLGKIRSAGVTDMRFGNVMDEHWQGQDRFGRGSDSRTPVPLPRGVSCYAIAATTALEPDGPLPSDGLVPVDSALGRHERPELTLAFPEANRWVAYGTSHLDLLSRPDVYAKIVQWCSTTTDGRTGGGT